MKKLKYFVLGFVLGEVAWYSSCIGMAGLSGGGNTGPFSHINLSEVPGIVMMGIFPSLIAGFLTVIGFHYLPQREKVEPQNKVEASEEQAS